MISNVRENATAAPSTILGRNKARATYHVLLSFSLLLTLVALASGQNMVSAPVDPANRVALKGHTPAWATAQNDLGAVPADLMLEQLMIVLNRPAAVEKAYTQLLADQQNPNSPRYHHWLTPIETGQRFGLSTHDIEAVTAWLQSQGLTVDSVSNSRVRITFSGTAASIGNAFGSEMHYFQVGEEKRISLTSAPQIPAALQSVIRAVSGLSTVHMYPQHQMQVGEMHLKESSDKQVPVPEGTLPDGSHVIFPADFATIYNLNGIAGGFNGSGQNIAIIGRSRVCTADITNFASIAGVTINGGAPVTAIVPPTGIDPGNALCTGTAGGDQDEATLDVTRSGSIAQGSHVLLVISADSQTTDGIQVASSYAVDKTPILANVMSISFGLCEAAAPSEATAYDSLFQQAASEGISVFISAGDSGAAGCDAAFMAPPSTPGFAAPNVICSSGYGTCVGGTEFNDTANPTQYWSTSNSATFGSALSYIPEGAWNEPLNSSSQFQVAGTGGGVSLEITPTPTWQVGTGVPAARAGRYTPDVAFSASGHDAYFGCLAASGGSSGEGACVVASNGSFSFVEFSGTSAAAPDMAGIAAILNQSQGAAQGQLNPKLYQLASNTGLNIFNDVTVTSSGVTNCTVATPSMCNNSVASATALTGGTQGFLVTAGYDEATGLGSINVANLLASWASALKSTQTALATSAAQIPIGGTVTFTATVTPASGTGTPTGTVNFLDGTTAIGTSTLSAGVAAFTTSTLASGLRSITAVYSGDLTFATSTSSVLSETVGTLTQTTVQTSAAQVLPGTSVTFTATVAATSGSGTPTGSVNFVADGSTQLGSGTLTNGVATLMTSNVPFGIHTITGVYSGDTTFAVSTSAGVMQTIGTSSQTSLQTSAAQIAQGTGVTFTAIVAASSGGAGTPTGTVVFLDGGNQLGTATLNAGTAVFATSTLSAGVHSITAAYQQSYPFLGSTSSIVSQSVVTISVAASPTALSLTAGGTGTVLITVTPTAGYTPKITVTCSGTIPAGACNVGAPTTGSNGVQTFVVSITTTAKSNRQVPLGMFVPMGFLLPLGALFVVGRGKRRSLGWLGLTLLLAVSTLWLAGCGGSSSGNPGTPVGTYTLGIAAKTSDSLAITSNTQVTLNVQ